MEPLAQKMRASTGVPPYTPGAGGSTVPLTAFRDRPGGRRFVRRRNQNPTRDRTTNCITAGIISTPFPIAEVGQPGAPGAGDWRPAGALLRNSRSRRTGPRSSSASVHALRSWHSKLRHPVQHSALDRGFDFLVLDRAGREALTPSIALYRETAFSATLWRVQPLDFRHS